MNGLLLCEYHHFYRLELICAKCNNPLKGPFIKSKTHKYHLEHFTCSLCDFVFRQNDSYYERDDKIYCPEHYANAFAAVCQGCQMSVLNNYVELKREDIMEQWHPNCYMLYKVFLVFMH